MFKFILLIIYLPRCSVIEFILFLTINILQINFNFCLSRYRRLLARFRSTQYHISFSANHRVQASTLLPTYGYKNLRIIIIIIIIRMY